MKGWGGLVYWWSRFSTRGSQSVNFTYFYVLGVTSSISLRKVDALTIKSSQELSWRPTFLICKNAKFYEYRKQRPWHHGPHSYAVGHCCKTRLQICKFCLKLCKVGIVTHKSGHIFKTKDSNIIQEKCHNPKLQWLIIWVISVSPAWDGYLLTPGGRSSYEFCQPTLYFSSFSKDFYLQVTWYAPQGTMALLPIWQSIHLRFPLSPGLPGF